MKTRHGCPSQVTVLIDHRNGWKGAPIATSILQVGEQHQGSPPGRARWCRASRIWKSVVFALTSPSRDPVS